MIQWIKLFKVSLMHFCVFSLMVCSAQNADRSQLKLNILTLGDSNGTFPNSWPKQIQSMLPESTVCNISKSGRTIGFSNLGDSTLNSLAVIEQNLAKAAKYIGTSNYDYIILELGTNDAKAIFASLQDSVPKNLDRLIKKIQSSTFPSIRAAKIIIISPPPYGSKAESTDKYQSGGKRIQAMALAFKKVAEENNCFFVNGFITPGLDIEAMTSDGLHLDAEGSLKLIEPVIKKIRN